MATTSNINRWPTWGGFNSVWTEEKNPCGVAQLALLVLQSKQVTRTNTLAKQSKSDANLVAKCNPTPLDKNQASPRTKHTFFCYQHTSQLCPIFTETLKRCFSFCIVFTAKWTLWQRTEWLSAGYLPLAHLSLSLFDARAQWRHIKVRCDFIQERPEMCSLSTLFP